MTTDSTVTADPADDIDIAASYSRQDADLVVPLLDALKARGVKVWFDKNIPGGALWEETITRNMRRAKAVVFFASKSSLASDRCFDEVSAARTLKKPIIPVLVDRVRVPDDLPDRLVLTLQTRNTVEAWPGVAGDPVAVLMHALASFGVTGHAADAAPAPTVPVAAPIVPPPPPPEPAKPAPAAAPTKGRSPLLWAAAAAAVLVLGAGGLYAAGVFGGGPAGGAGAGTEAITEAEWCSVPAPKLLKRTTLSAAALQAAADEGDLTALTLQCLSANAACTGGGDTSALGTAFAACVKAGDKGSKRALFNQGWLKQRGCGGPVDSAGAVTAITRSAEGGCAMAQFYLGTLYLDGEMVAFDEAAGIKWLTAAADQNHPPALNRLGAAYALGRGVPEDDVRGTEYYRRAADLGDARAMLNYARALEIGVGTDKNTGAAIAYYRRAAEQTDDAEIRGLAEDALKRLGADRPDKT